MRTELVTTLKRRATELLAQLKADADPILITQHGLPAAYLVDVDAYDKLQKRFLRSNESGRFPQPFTAFSAFGEL